MKRRFIAAFLSAAMILTGIPVNAAGVSGQAAAQSVEPKSTAFQQALESKYIDPDRIYSSDVRWWLGTASATDETLLEEIQALYDGGFRGMELCMQSDVELGGGGPPGASGGDSQKPSKEDEETYQPGDPTSTAPNATYAYGSAMWNHKWKLMMDKLLDLGMGVYLTSGTNWNTSNVPATDIDPNSIQAMQVAAMPLYKGTYLNDGKEKYDNAYDKVTVKSGQTLAGKLQTPNLTRKNTTLLGAYAYEMEEKNGKVYVGGTPIELSVEKGSLTKNGDTDYNINWTAPAADGTEKTYIVLPVWTQGAYQSSSPAVTECYATNYFDEEGVEALKAFWNKNYLNDDPDFPDLKEKIKKGDVQLFMDSLEISVGETGKDETGKDVLVGGFTYWSEGFQQDFIDAKGYDILPYLFLLNGVGSGSKLPYSPYCNYEEDCLYGLSGEDGDLTREKIINDWLDFLTRKYEEEMLTPLKTWLNGVGIKTRAQISYGRSFEITEPSQYVDYPEAENLNEYNQIDIFRLHTAGAKLESKVLSTETGGTSKLYGASIQTLLQDIYSQYAAGFQRVIWHVWTASYGYGNYDWPGYLSGFNDAFYRWGNRQPSSANYDEFNSHIGRVQQLMQTGDSRTDVGFVHNNWYQGMRTGGEQGGKRYEAMNWQYAHQGVHYRSTELQDHGYTYDYFSPDFLFNENVTFNKTTKTIEKAGYKALVLYQDWLDLKAARKILELAKEGLPVVIVKGAAVKTTFKEDSDNDLKAVMDELKDQTTVRVANVTDPVDYGKAEEGGYDDEVYEKLQELGVRPYAEFDGANHQLLTQTRQDAQGNRYLYAYNYCPNNYHENSSIASVRNEDHGTNIKTEIRMDGQYIPYSIDAWTGKVTQLGQYRYEDGQTVIPIDLDFSDIALYAFEKANQEDPSIVSTNAASSYMGENGPVIRATKSGTYNTTLSTGKSYTDKITVPEAFDIKNWNLTVQSWTANPQKGDLRRKETVKGVTTVNKKTSTVKTPITKTLDTLDTWDNIDGIGKNVSGEGVYKATFNWDSSKATGAYIDFGDSLQETMEVLVNGKKVGGAYSANPTKAKKSVGVEIDNGEGQKSVPEGKKQYTGGLNWKSPVADISEYLVNGSNTIELRYNSSLTNVMLATGKISRLIYGEAGPNPWLQQTWWGEEYNVDYRSYGPKQAKIVPYVDVDQDVRLQDTQGALKDAQNALTDAQNQVKEKEQQVAAIQKQVEEKEKALANANTATEQQRKAAAEAQAALAKAQKELEAAKAAEKKAKEKADKLEFQAKKITLSKVTSPKKGQAKAAWKKVSGASGYQIQYATKSNFKGKKTLTVKGGKKTSATIKKLSKGKKYYVRIRAYKTIGGKKAYTAFSAKKSVKVKK